MWYEGQPFLLDLPRFNIPRCAECGELVFDNWADEQIERAFRAQVGLLSVRAAVREGEKPGED
jgi:hypothetical protein